MAFSEAGSLGVGLDQRGVGRRADRVAHGASLSGLRPAIAHFGSLRA